MVLKILLTVLLAVLIENVKGEEAFCTISGRKPLQKVSEKFLSVSIDPAVLLAGLNLSESSLKLAKHLSPAFVRIAGPSTQFLQFSEDALDGTDDVTPEKVIVTSPMWYGLNDWLSSANLTPIFGINDHETTRGLWNPKSTLPLLEWSDKFNVTCHWQLGFDCSNKTEQQYKQDLSILRNIIDAFPENRDGWKVVGSDLSRCLPKADRSFFEDIKDLVVGVMWESQDKPPLNGGFQPPLWTSVPKSERPACFDSAILWAEQLGEAARTGYEVVFRQPRLHELFSETPVFWFSLLHKKLMGSVVLDVRTSRLSDSAVYGHCTKKQNSFVRRGAATIMAINNGTSEFHAMIRLGGTLPHAKTTEVQSYILTADSMTRVLLNGELLTMDLLDDEKSKIQPKLRRAKLNKPIILSLPPKSIGFFVLTSAQIPACIQEETEMDLLLEEIQEDQNQEEDIQIELAPRGAFGPKFDLKQLRDKYKKEQVSDEKFYKKQSRVKTTPVSENKLAAKPPKIRFDARNYFIERAKLAERHKTRFRPLLGEVRKSEVEVVPTKPTIEPIKLELSSSEVKTVLKNRAKNQGKSKNIVFSSAELDEIIGKATKRFGLKRLRRDLMSDLKNKLEDGKEYVKKTYEKMPSWDELKVQLQKKWDDWKTKLHPDNLKAVFDKFGRSKRDINLDLIKGLTEPKPLKKPLLKNTKKPLTTKKPLKSKFEDGEEKEATIRKSGQTTDELLDELESSDISESVNPRKKDIFAELQGSDESTKKVQRKKSKKLSEDDRIQVLTASDPFDDFEEDFPNIHEFYEATPTVQSASPKLEMWESLVKETLKTRNKKDSDEHALFKRDLSDVKTYKKMLRRNLKDFKYLQLKEERVKMEEELNNLLKLAGKSDYLVAPPEKYGKMKNQKKELYKKMKVLQNELVKTKTLENKMAEQLSTSASYQAELQLLEQIAEALEKPEAKLLTKRSATLFGSYEPLNWKQSPWKPSDLTKFKPELAYFQRPCRCKRHLSEESYNENAIEKNSVYEVVLPNKSEVGVKINKEGLEPIYTPNKHEHIQKIPTKEQQNGVKALFSKMAELARDLTGKIKSCFEYFTG